MTEQSHPSTHAPSSNSLRDVGAWSHDTTENDGSSATKRLCIEHADEKPRPGGPSTPFKIPGLGDDQREQSDNAEAKKITGDQGETGSKQVINRPITHY